MFPHYQLGSGFKDCQSRRLRGGAYSGNLALLGKWFKRFPSNKTFYGSKLRAFTAYTLTDGTQRWQQGYPPEVSEKESNRSFFVSASRSRTRYEKETTPDSGWTFGMGIKLSRTDSPLPTFN